MVDGDTISIMSSETNAKGKRIPSFSVRMRCIEAPERSRKNEQQTGTTILLAAMGRGKKKYDAGSLSYEMVSILTRQKCILVIPSLERLKDEHDRLIGDVYVSGLAGKSFSKSGSFSLERVLIEDGLVTARDNEDLPSYDLPLEFTNPVRERPSSLPSPSF